MDFHGGNFLRNLEVATGNLMCHRPRCENRLNELITTTARVEKCYDFAPIQYVLVLSVAKACFGSTIRSVRLARELSLLQRNILMPYFQYYISMETQTCSCRLLSSEKIYKTQFILCKISNFWFKPFFLYIIFFWLLDIFLFVYIYLLTG